MTLIIRCVKRFGFFFFKPMKSLSGRNFTKFIEFSCFTWHGVYCLPNCTTRHDLRLYTARISVSYGPDGVPSFGFVFFFFLLRIFVNIFEIIDYYYCCCRTKPTEIRAKKKKKILLIFKRLRNVQQF